MDRQLTIQEVSRRTGLSAHTLRYYERISLIGPIDRGTSSGHRRYASADLAWIEFHERLRATGMPIREMLAFAELRRGGEATDAARRALLEGHLDVVERRIQGLRQAAKAVKEKIVLYREIERQALEAVAPSPIS